MSQYLLLRNNKESGPYSADQLIIMGLKAYDLVWENGRSAAWRYPSEVAVLKAFAPATENFTSLFTKRNEEQIPTKTDNTFVKKEKPRIKIKADWKKVEAVNSQQTIVDSSRLNFTEPAFIQTTKKETLNESFANNEASTLSASITNYKHQTTNIPHPISNETPSWQNAWLDWEEEKKSVAGLNNHKAKNNIAEKKYDFIRAKKIDTEPKLETKFSQSLDDIKEKYVENILKSKEKKSFNAGSIFNKQVIVLLLLIGLISWGMYVAFFMQDGGATNKPVTVQPDPALVPQTVTVPKDVATNDQSNSIPLNDEKGNVASTNKSSSSKNISNKNDLLEPQKKVVAIAKSRNISKKKLPPASSRNLIAKQNSKQPTRNIFTANKNISSKKYSSQPNILTSQPAGHSEVVQQGNGQYTRTVARRSDNNSATNNSVNNTSQPAQTIATSSFPHAAPKKRIEDYVTVSSSGSGYTGVQNVHLNVQNITDVPIDLAVVDIQYFDANNCFQKGETVYVNNIPANDNVDVKVPDSRSSAKINYKVSLVSASQKTLYLVQ